MGVRTAAAVARRSPFSPACISITRPSAREKSIPSDRSTLAAGLRGRRRSVLEQPEQEMLGADEVVAEQPGALLGKDQDTSRPAGEVLEHYGSLG